MTSQEGSVDVSDRLDALAALVSSARAMPMSASCIVNRAEVLEAIEAVHAALPDELVKARRLLSDAGSVMEQGRAEAAEIVAAAEAERSRLVASSEVAAEARREVERLDAASQADIERMRAEIDDYVDVKLANFEVVLHKTLAAVERGRAKIQSRHGDLEVLSEDELATEPVEPLPG